MSAIGLSVEGVAVQIGQAFGALQPRLAPENVRTFFADLGLQFPPSFDDNADVKSALERASTAAGNVASKAGELRRQIDANAPSATLIALGIETITLFGIGVAKLGGSNDSVQSVLRANSASLGLPAALVEEFAADLPVRILHHSIMTFAEDKVFRLVNLLGLFGIVQRTPGVVRGTPDASFFISRQIALGNVLALLKDPAAHLNDLYGFGGPDFGNPTALAKRNGRVLLDRLSDLLVPLGYYPTLLERPDDLPILDSFLFSLAVTRETTPAGIALRAKIELDDVSFSDQLVKGWAVASTVSGAWPEGVGVTFQPPDRATFLLADDSPLSTKLTYSFIGTADDGGPLRLFGQTGGALVQAASVAIEASIAATAAGIGAPILTIRLNGGRAIVDLSSGDGFLGSLTAGKPIEANFQLGAKLSIEHGLVFEAGGSLAIEIPLHVSFAGIRVDNLNLAIRLDQVGSGLPIEFATSLGATFGPFQALIDQVGLALTVTFPSGGGNLGILDFQQPKFKPPTGIALSLDAGSVKGGGFLSFDETRGRYTGAVELQVYAIAVKAFGLLETKLPNGHPGFSFVIVISAEFTPIQLGFGFTLLGVGGLLGVNRSLNDDGLGSAVRSGSLDNILFPTNLAQNAPSIIHDLETIFPAAPGHYVFGPMAKLGWGTPTLIDAEFGIVLELPGPRLAILGVAHMALPTKQAALLAINVAVAGTLDFPKKLFTIAASLYDSQVVGYRISGDMAFRLSFGDQPNFALSLGGLNPSYTPPPGFPELRRLSVDLGINGNPSLTAQGYFALTSNTAQVGAAINLHASGFGIDLDGHLGFDALFVLSPFSFVAGFSAGVSVSFHGVGLGVSLNGSISGPTPWHVSAEACVSVLFWDACLPIDFSFGTDVRAPLPEIDPWVGNHDNGVDGLVDGVSRAVNWSGSFPPGMHPVVSLTDDTKRPSPPIDPVGQATLHQKILPLNFRLTKFGIYQPKENTIFRLKTVLVNGAAVKQPPPPAKDMFAPALYKDMSDAEKLSSEPYQPFDSGFTVSPDNIAAGDLPSHEVKYQTKVIDDHGQDSNALLAQFALRHLTALSARSAAGLGGIRRSGAQRFVDPTAAVKVRMLPELFVAADATSRKLNPDLTDAAPQTGAQNAIDAHVTTNPEDRGRFQAVPSYLAA